jgi:cephalosporin hydroxylase
MNLSTDSSDYDVLYRAASSIKDVDGAICEIGTRLGGSLQYIVGGLLSSNDLNRNIVCVDPYGNIDYYNSEFSKAKSDYTNDMRNTAMANIYEYLKNKPVNVVLLCLEDTEYFDKFKDGFPFYQEYKQIINQYSLVFFDGPHVSNSVLNEVQFFYPRSVVGSKFVFDDIDKYDHQSIHNDLIKNNFQLIDFGTNQVKACYIKIK